MLHTGSHSLCKRIMPYFREEPCLHVPIFGKTCWRKPQIQLIHGDENHPTFFLDLNKWRIELATNVKVYKNEVGGIICSTKNYLLCWFHVVRELSILMMWSLDSFVWLRTSVALGLKPCKRTSVGKPPPCVVWDTFTTFFLISCKLLAKNDGSRVPIAHTTTLKCFLWAHVHYKRANFLCQIVVLNQNGVGGFRARESWKTVASRRKCCILKIWYFRENKKNSKESQVKRSNGSCGQCGLHNSSAQMDATASVFMLEMVPTHSFTAHPSRSSFDAFVAFSRHSASQTMYFEILYTCVLECASGE